jgi:hypothetical protein
MVLHADAPLEFDWIVDQHGKPDAGGESVMMKRLICAAIALCVASSANAATLRLKNYLAPADEKQRILNAVYLDGLKDGLLAFNIAVARTGTAPLFCLPPTMELTHPYPDDMIVSIVLLASLRKTFPCGEQSK